MLDSWKHCPHCGFQIVLPELDCMFPVPDKNVKAPGWNPLFLKAEDLVEELIRSGFAKTKLELADSQWDELWIEEFNHNHFRVAFRLLPSEETEIEFHGVITSQTVDEMLNEKFLGLENPQVRLIDDGWYIEVVSHIGGWEQEERVAIELQESYGGEVFVAKPRKKSTAKTEEE